MQYRFAKKKPSLRRARNQMAEKVQLEMMTFLDQYRQILDQLDELKKTNDWRIIQQICKNHICSEIQQLVS